MSRQKLSAFDTAPDLITMDYFVGVRDNEDGTFSNYKYTYAQIAALASAAPKARIVVTTDGDSLTDVFFETNTIDMIVTQNQIYLSDVDFTQTTDTITWINGMLFFAGQTINALV